MLTMISSPDCLKAQQASEIDTQVEEFLNQMQYRWRDMNVPASDGKVLYDLIVTNGYTRALEIGTSTGHSGIWLAWALSKTGGKLTTIEIDEGRYKEAMKNFKAAGLSDYVDLKLGDAHKMVRELPGPFDFVFCDADKGWYKNYLIDLMPKMEIGGCYTAHNVRMRMYGITEFLDYLDGLENMETTIDRTSRSGISISYKRK